MRMIPATPDSPTRGDGPRGDADLGDLWRVYARRTSDTGLFLCVSVSILIIASLAVIGLLHARWALRWWPVVLPPIIVGAFGTWGIADREIAERRSNPSVQPLALQMLIGVEWASCIAAGLAAAAAMIVFLRLTVGTWIS
ncbi:MAG TPA: hypothetical protein VF785_19525 [Gemmatimonadaceae bacterium]